MAKKKTAKKKAAKKATKRTKGPPTVLDYLSTDGRGSRMISLRDDATELLKDKKNATLGDLAKRLREVIENLESEIEQLEEDIETVNRLAGNVADPRLAATYEEDGER